MTKTEKSQIEKKLYRDYFKVTKANHICTDVYPTIKLSRVKKCAGDVNYWSGKWDKKITRIDIRISQSYYEKFGYKRSYETLMHEIAHIAVFAQYKRDSGANGHGEHFQKWCMRLGGSMSKHFTSAENMDSTTDEYIDHRKWSYTCPKCGCVNKTIRRKSEKKRTSTRYICGVCGTNFNLFVEKQI